MLPSVMAGKLLYVNLSTGEMEDRPIADEEIRAYLLGSGLAAKIYYDMLDPDVDPLDPASPLIVINGLLSGTISPVMSLSRVDLPAPFGPTSPIFVPSWISQVTPSSTSLLA